MNKYIVQKFGGTCIGQSDNIIKVIDIIKDCSINNNMAVVVSAMSNYDKSSGTTSKLLLSLEVCLIGGDYISILDEVKKNHLEIINIFLLKNNNTNMSKKRWKLYSDTYDFVESEFKQLHNVLNNMASARCNDAILTAVTFKIKNNISYKSKDIILNVGERLSAYIISSILNANNIKALLLGIRPYLPI